MRKVYVSSTPGRWALQGSAILWILCSAASAGFAAEPTATSLSGLRAQYEPIHSLHLKASVLLTIHRPGGLGTGAGGPTVGSASFEYWADGQRYRIRSTSDPRLDLTQDFDVAYDGSEFQLFDIGRSTLSVRQDDLRQLPIALPNPFFLPLDFLSQDNDDCLLCRLKLQHLMSDTLWQERWSSATSVAASSAPGGDLVYDIPGGTIGGETFQHRIYLLDEGDRLRRIERYTSGGNLMLRIDLSAHELFQGPGAASTLPRHISVTTFNYRGDGSALLESDFVVDELEINPSFSQADFKISRETPEYVYESDREAFLKRPEP